MNKVICNWSYIYYIRIQSFELHFKNLPIFNKILALRVARESERRFRTTYVFPIIVADWKLCIWSLLMTVVNNADITAPKNRAFVWIVRDCKLSQV